MPSSKAFRFAKWLLGTAVGQGIVRARVAAGASELADQRRTVALAGDRGGLAAPVGTRAGAVAAINMAGAGRAARLVAGNAAYRRRRQRHGQGHRSRAQALAGAGTLCQFGHTAERQQFGRERHSSDRHRQEELAVHRVGAGRPPRRRHPEPVRHRQTQRP